MKLLAAAILLVTLACACSRSNDTPIIRSSIVGNWSLMDSPAVDGVFLNFIENGQIEHRKWDTLLPIQYNRFAIINDSTVRLFKQSGSVDAIFHINHMTLTLEGACIVHCIENYGRILATD